MTTEPGVAHAQRDLWLAWISLGGYVLSFPVAFLVGEGLASALGYSALTAISAPWWVPVVAGLPALVVFWVPGLLALYFGRRAMHAGDQRGSIPAAAGVVVGLVFVALNLLGFAVALL